ncbi:phosphopantetheine-binding protein [Nonomuraea thailandensis]
MGSATVEEVLACLADVLELRPSDLDPDAPLTTLGLESFTAVRLRRRLLEESGLGFPLTAFLGSATARTVAAGIVPDEPAGDGESFPLTPIQTAYLVGRDPAFPLGEWRPSTTSSTTACRRALRRRTSTVWRPRGTGSSGGIRCCAWSWAPMPGRRFSTRCRATPSPVPTCVVKVRNGPGRRWSRCARSARTRCCPPTAGRCSTCVRRCCRTAVPGCSSAWTCWPWTS